MIYAKQICSLCVVLGPRLFIPVAVIQISMVIECHVMIIKMSGHRVCTNVIRKRCAVILGHHIAVVV